MGALNSNKSAVDVIGYFGVTVPPISVQTVPL